MAKTDIELEKVVDEYTKQINSTLKIMRDLDQQVRDLNSRLEQVETEQKHQRFENQGSYYESRNE